MCPMHAPNGSKFAPLKTHYNIIADIDAKHARRVCDIIAFLSPMSVSMALLLLQHAHAPQKENLPDGGDGISAEWFGE